MSIRGTRDSVMPHVPHFGAADSRGMWVYVRARRERVPPPRRGGEKKTSSCPHMATGTASGDGKKNPRQVHVPPSALSQRLREQATLGPVDVSTESTVSAAAMLTNGSVVLAAVDVDSTTTQHPGTPVSSSSEDADASSGSLPAPTPVVPRLWPRPRARSTAAAADHQVDVAARVRALVLTPAPRTGGHVPCPVCAREDRVQTWHDERLYRIYLCLRCQHGWTTLYLQRPRCLRRLSPGKAQKKHKDGGGGRTRCLEFLTIERHLGEFRFACMDCARSWAFAEYEAKAYAYRRACKAKGRVDQSGTLSA